MAYPQLTIYYNRIKENASFLRTICQNQGIDVVAAWCDAIDKGEHSLNKEDVIIIKEFANALGTSDIKLQLENIANTVSRLKIRQENAMENYKKYCKMCKTLGVTSGILIVTLFI